MSIVTGGLGGCGTTFLLRGLGVCRQAFGGHVLRISGTLHVATKKRRNTGLRTKQSSESALNQAKSADTGVETKKSRDTKLINLIEGETSL